MPVVVKLCGGLGNQMFQYSAARRLAKVNNTDLLMDTVSRYQNDPYNRIYLLDQFNINASQASAFESLSFPGAGIIRRLDKKMPYKYRLYHTEKGFAEPTKAFDEQILALRKKNIILEGNWQCEKYFEDIQNIIKEELQIIVKHEDATLKEADEIRGSTAVGVGVRLYEEIPNELSYHHPILNISYFMNAMNEMAKKIESAHFFIICENPDRIQEDFKSSPHNITFITHKHGDILARENLWLMSLCQHHIISNSSYHWWGAWLGEQKDSIVMVPDHGTNNLNMFPERWTKVKANYTDHEANHGA